MFVHLKIERASLLGTEVQIYADGAFCHQQLNEQERAIVILHETLNSFTSRYNVQRWCYSGAAPLRTCYESVKS